MREGELLAISYSVSVSTMYIAESRGSQGGREDNGFTIGQMKYSRVREGDSLWKDYERSSGEVGREGDFAFGLLTGIPVPPQCHKEDVLIKAKNPHGHGRYVGVSVDGCVCACVLPEWAYFYPYDTWGDKKKEICVLELPTYTCRWATIKMSPS